MLRVEDPHRRRFYRSQSGDPRRRDRRSGRAGRIRAHRICRNPIRPASTARRADLAENREISRDSTRARPASGLVYLPEDRQVSGCLDAPVRWNTVMFNQPSWWQQGKREAAVVERYHRALGISWPMAISRCALSLAVTSRRCCWALSGS